MRRRNTMALQEFLGKTFAGFQLSSGPGRTEDTPAAPRKLIYYAEQKRQFRTNDGEVGLDLVGERDHGVEVLDVYRDALRIVRDAPVPRRAINFRDPWRLPQLPD